MNLSYWVYRGLVKAARYDFESHRTVVEVVGTVEAWPEFRQFVHGYAFKNMVRA